jgi:hydrogenase nickel incorporation protein HypA/HybF
MHELAIAGEIKDIVLAKLKEHKLSKVTGIKLVFGEMTSVVPEAIRFAFASISEKTPMSGAKIRIKMIRSKALCNSCGKNFRIKDLAYICPECSSADIKITAGREMIVQTIDME